MTTITRRIIAAMTGTIIVVGLPLVPAAAHSQLESASPALDAELKVSPRTVTLEFNETVSVADKGVQLLDARGKQVAAASAANTAVVKIPTPKLKAGRYVIRWRVISADGHVIVASYAFAVGTTTPKAKPVKVNLADTLGRIALNTDGAAPGRRTMTLALSGIEGTLELKNPLFGAPMLWTLKPTGSTMTAAGMIPSPGTWTITARVRVGQFDERVLVGKLVVAA